jgi:hypothetical protein
VTPASLRPRAPGSRGRLPNPLSGLYCTKTQVAPAQISVLENAIRQQPTRLGPPVDLVSGRGMDPMLEQLHHRGL